MKNAFSVHHLADDELLRRTGELAVRGKQIEAVLIAHMAEVDHRRLYRGEACSSMFVYATERLRLSEAQAYERITVARRSREFPVLLEMLADGRLTLTAAAKLGPHLTRENAAALLARAVHATRRQVEVLVAEVAPRPDVPSSVRRLPARPSTRTPATAEVRPAGVPAPLPDPAVAVRPAGVPAPLPDPAVAVRPAGVPAPLPDPAVAVRPDAAPATIVPIAPARYRVQFTASAELEAKIARARALLRHKIPSGDIAAIIDEAVTMLVADLERTRCARAARPRTTTPTSSASRHVPAAVKRAVWRRDEGRCRFVDREGRRCESREALEIDHIEPFARGGETRLENLRLLCRTHNQYQAELAYGADFMAARRGPPSPAGEPVAPYAAGSTRAASIAPPARPAERPWRGDHARSLPRSRARTSRRNPKGHARNARAHASGMPDNQGDP